MKCLIRKMTHKLLNQIFVCTKTKKQEISHILKQTQPKPPFLKPKGRKPMRDRWSQPLLTQPRPPDENTSSHLPNLRAQKQKATVKGQENACDDKWLWTKSNVYKCQPRRRPTMMGDRFLASPNIIPSFPSNMKGRTNPDANANIKTQQPKCHSKTVPNLESSGGTARNLTQMEPFWKGSTTQSDSASVQSNFSNQKIVNMLMVVRKPKSKQIQISEVFIQIIPRNRKDGENAKKRKENTEPE